MEASSRMVRMGVSIDADAETNFTAECTLKEVAGHSLVLAYLVVFHIMRNFID